MLEAFFKKKFKKDLKRIQKQGKDAGKLKNVMEHLINQNPLDKKFLDHPLKGEYTDCRECHIEPDWLLIYLMDKKSITFIRTGSHSDLLE